MSVRTIVNNGKSSNRIDIVFLGDGYTASEIDTVYNNHVSVLTDYLFNGSLLTQPFGRYINYFNVHVIDVVSAESGADNPGTGVTYDTALDATYYFDGVTERLLYIDHFTTTSVMDAALSGTGIAAEMKFVTVNDSKYGGGGGDFAVYAGGNSDSLEVAVHEVAHAFANLADEYGGTPSTYMGSEPLEVNVTMDSTGAKWQNWLGYNQEGIGTIGAYEGGLYFDAGIYRPSDSSKMRDLNSPFDAISREAFVLEFYKYVDPLDDYAYSTVSGPLVDIDILSVTPIDTALINVDWFVNGASVKTGVTSITIADLGLSAGTYNITAKASDTTDWVRSDRSSLEQEVNWTVTLSNANPVQTFAELFDTDISQAKAISAIYEILLGGVPNQAGYTFLINENISKNFGSKTPTDPGPVFNDENIYINIANALVQGNSAATAVFNGLVGNLALVDQIISLYQSIVPVADQSVGGLIFFTRPEALTFYTQVAAERGITSADGPAVVAMAAILKVVVDENGGTGIGVGEAVHDLLDAVKAGSAAVPETSANFTPIETADGTAFDGDDVAPSPSLAFALFAGPEETSLHGYEAMPVSSEDVSADQLLAVIGVNDDVYWIG